MGNSEVGHLNIGAGRVVCQDLVRIDDASRRAPSSRTGRSSTLPAARGPALHLWDSSPTAACTATSPPGGADRARAPGGRRHVYVHAFTDGRDTSPHGAEGYLDGHPRRSRLSRAATTPWTATTAGTGPSAPTTRSSTASARGPTTRIEAAEAFYAAGVTDEFVEPVAIGDPAAGGSVRATPRSSSTSGRPRPPALAGVHRRDFDGFDRGPDPPLPHYVR